MNDIYISWLYQFKNDDRIYIAKAYIETMSEDVQKLKLTSVNTNLILSQLHKMKGGCAQIGIDAITNLIDRVEYVVKTDSKNHSREVENLIKEIELSITSLIEWCDER